MKNIILIGMPASGKSTVGVILAKLLGYNFVDTDILLSLSENRPLSRIITEDGYDKFIKLEGLVGEGMKCIKSVVATGGSMVFSECAMKTLSNHGLVVWLDVPVEELERRMVGTLIDRGVATPSKMSLRDIFELREPLYRKFAQLRVPCLGTTEQVATDLRDKLVKDKLI